MLKIMAGGWVLFFLLAVSTTAVAAEERMTRDEYKARLAEYTEREQVAQDQIDILQAHIAARQTETRSLDADIARLRTNIYNLIDADEEELLAFSRQLDIVIRQLEGLMALRPEQLIQRRKELTSVEKLVAEHLAQKMSVVPQMRLKLDRIEQMLAQLRARVSQPVTIDYIVVRGDNLWNIASKDDIYADPFMWPRIYRANRGDIKDPDLIYPNQTLAIPFGVAENQYLVTRGDFLTRIAAEVYNDPNQWHRIYQANRQQIVEPQLIFPAQVLDIPGN